MTPRLEDFRQHAPVGTSGYQYLGGATQPFLFHDSAQSAFYITVDALTRFQAQQFIGGNAYVIPSIGLWFLTTESYVSTVTRSCS